MTDAEKAALPPKMQEAVKFVEYWQLSSSIPEFIMAMEWPIEKKSWIKASQFAVKLRKNGVPLKKLRDKAADYDFSYLQLVGQRALAELGRQKEAAQVIFDDIKRLYTESHRLMIEMRKFKNKAIVYESMMAEGEINGT